LCMVANLVDRAQLPKIQDQPRDLESLVTRVRGIELSMCGPTPPDFTQ
jgi:hypothetical protein